MKRLSLSDRWTLFVVGTGRSGTHFVTDCLIKSRDVTDLTRGRENRWLFDEVAAIATGRRPATDVRDVIRKYRLMRLVAPTKVLVDQSHSSLWFSDEVAAAIPRSRFVAMVRDPRAVVASMLQHDGVRRRTEEWRAYPFPNPFLGVDEENCDDFERASLAGKCAYRWVAHIERTAVLLDRHPQRTTVVAYEQLVTDPLRQMERVLDPVDANPAEVGAYRARPASLDKWRQQLDAAEVDEIDRIAATATSYARLTSAAD
jgi:hypothetical protein